MLDTAFTGPDDYVVEIDGNRDDRGDLTIRTSWVVDGDRWTKPRSRPLSAADTESLAIGQERLSVADRALVIDLLLGKRRADLWKTMRRSSKSGARIVLHLTGDARVVGVPWEQALLDDVPKKTRRPSIVRTRARPAIGAGLDSVGRAMVLRSLWGLEEPRRQELQDLRALLRRTGLGWSDLTLEEMAERGTEADLLHVTAQAGGGDDSILLEAASSHQVPATRLTTMVNDLGAAVVVLAVCGDTPGGAGEVARRLFDDSRASVVIAMRATVTYAQARDFSSTFYRGFLDQGLPVEQAFIKARDRLDPDAGLPHLYASSAAALALRARPRPDNPGPAARVALGPPPALPGLVWFRERLWEVGASGGRLQLTAVDTDEVEADEDSDPLVVAADGRAAATWAGSTVDAAWLVPAAGELTLVRPPWTDPDGRTPLPPELAAAEPRLLAMSVPRGAHFRFLLATPGGTVHVALGPHGWSATTPVGPVAVAGTDTTPRPTLAPLSSPVVGAVESAFGRRGRLSDLDVGRVGDREVAVAIRAGGAIVVADRSTRGRWRKLALHGPTVQGARRVTVVRSLRSGPDEVWVAVLGPDDGAVRVLQAGAAGFEHLLG